MAEDQQFFQQYLRSTTPDGTETVREVVSPSLLDEGAAQQAETAAGRTFVGFVHPDDMPSLGAQPAAPPQPPPEAPPVARQTLPPERSFVSQTPSMVGGVLGGMAGGAALGALGGPLAVATVPLGAIAGAALGSGGMEALQAAAERAPGATSPPSEPGTPLERGKRAAARGAVGEVIGLPFRGAQALLAARTTPVLEAAETLAPVLRQAVPEAAGPVRASVALADPEYLLPRWWNRWATRPPGEIVQAWDALGAEGQQALAGARTDAMQTVVDTLRAGQGKLDLAGLAKQGGFWGITLKALGAPAPIAEAAAAAPAVLRVATQALPRIATPMLLSPTSSQWLASLPQVGRVAAPWADVGLRAAGQAGTAAVWPPPYAPPGG